MGRVFEIPIKGEGDAASRVGMFNQQIRDDIASVVAAVGIDGPAPAAIDEPSTVNNSTTLPAGRNYGCHLKVADTNVRALSAGCFMTRMAIIEEDAVFDGIHFTSSDDNIEELVKVRSPAVAVFRNCTFEKGPTATRIYIRVEAGAKTLFVGCVFKGNPSDAGDIINNPNPAADCQIVGCYNKTTHAFGTVTTTASI